MADLTNTRRDYTVDEIIAYECGEMEDDDVVDFFQRLINSGDCWTLQGCYGRMAMSLIEQGLCHSGRA